MMYQMSEIWTELTVVETSVTAYLHLALYMNAQGIREFEGMEEGIGDDRCPLVGPFRLEESADHLRSQDTSVLVRKLNDMAGSIGCCTRFHSHVEFTCGNGKVGNHSKDPWITDSHKCVSTRVTQNRETAQDKWQMTHWVWEFKYPLRPRAIATENNQLNWESCIFTKQIWNTRWCS